MRKHFIVPSIRSREVACAEWPDIRRFEHLLYLLNLVNDAFNVNAVPISNMSVAIVKRERHPHGDCENAQRPAGIVSGLP